MPKEASSTTENLLDVHGLRTRFYTSRGVVKAVDGINLRIKKLETVGLVGESGSGKTVTALSIMGLVPSPGRIVEGEILFKDMDLLKLTEKEMESVRGAQISMVFQDPMTYLNPVMKIEKQVAEVISLHQTVNPTDVKRKVIEALETVRIPSPSKIAQHYPHELSGGMRQRVLIATAIACNPSLLIADEPTTALDVTVQAQILDLLEELVEERGASLLLITHDLGIVAEICDKVYIMYAGKISEYADVLAIYENPCHPYTIGLLKSVMSIDEFKETLVAINGTVPDMINPPLGCRFHPRCQKAKPICHKQEPPMVKIEPDHVVACWLYRE